MLRLIAILASAIFVASPAAAQSAGEFRPTNGVGTGWMITIVGIVGTLFPDIADDWVEFGHRKLVRAVSALLSIIGTTLLADHYFDLDLMTKVFG